MKAVIQCDDSYFGYDCYFVYQVTYVIFYRKNDGRVVSRVCRVGY